MTDLYKVSPPRDDLTFHPTTFWRSDDWESSSDRPKPGYHIETVLYAGDFDEVSIHLFPRVRVVRVRSLDVDDDALLQLVDEVMPCRAWIFVETVHRDQVERFEPTVFRLPADGFLRVRRGEYVCREAVMATSQETISMTDAIRRWDLEVRYVSRLDDVIAILRQQKVYFDEQT